MVQVEIVIACATLNDVGGAIVGIQGVVAVAADQRFVAIVAVEVVVARSAAQDVIATRAVEVVVAATQEVEVFGVVRSVRFIGGQQAAERVLTRVSRASWVSTI